MRDQDVAMPSPAPLLPRLFPADRCKPEQRSAHRARRPADETRVTTAETPTRLTAAELRSTHLAPARRFAEGYAADEVDAFLARAADALDHRGTDGGDLSAEDVVEATFTPTRRGGYDQESVDDLLDRVVVALGGVPPTGAASPPMSRAATVLLVLWSVLLAAGVAVWAAGPADLAGVGIAVAGLALLAEVATLVVDARRRRVHATAG